MWTEKYLNDWISNPEEAHCYLCGESGPRDQMKEHRKKCHSTTSSMQSLISRETETPEREPLLSVEMESADQCVIQEDSFYVQCEVCKNFMYMNVFEKHLMKRHAEYSMQFDAMLKRANQEIGKGDRLVICKLCNSKMPQPAMTKHLKRKHYTLRIGHTRIDDTRFNQFVAENRIYAAEGQLYIADEGLEKPAEIN